MKNLVRSLHTEQTDRRDTEMRTCLQQLPQFLCELSSTFLSSFHVTAASVRLPHMCTYMYIYVVIYIDMAYLLMSKFT